MTIMLRLWFDMHVFALCLLILYLISLKPGLPSEITITKRRRVGATSTSQYEPVWRGPGLRWNDNNAVTARQLQQSVSHDARPPRGRPRRQPAPQSHSATPSHLPSNPVGTQSSQTADNGH